MLVGRKSNLPFDALRVAPKPLLAYRRVSVLARAKTAPNRVNSRLTLHSRAPPFPAFRINRSFLCLAILARAKTTSGRRSTSGLSPRAILTRAKSILYSFRSVVRWRQSKGIA